MAISEAYDIKKSISGKDNILKMETNKKQAEHNSLGSVITKSYQNPDTPNTTTFAPMVDPGMYFDGSLLQGVQEVDFFNFFTEELIQDIVKHTNTYAWRNINKKQSYSKKDGSWKEASHQEDEQVIALIM